MIWPSWQKKKILPSYMNFLLIILIGALSYSLFKVKDLSFKLLGQERQHQHTITLAEESSVDLINKEQTKTRSNRKEQSMSSESEFPNLIGKTGEEAKGILEGGEFNDIVLVQIVEDGMMVTMGK